MTIIRDESINVIINHGLGQYTVHKSRFSLTRGEDGFVSDQALVIRYK